MRRTHLRGHTNILKRLLVHAGLARIRQANTRHGRYSREQVELARLMREHQMNFTERAMAMRGTMRDYFLRVARPGAVPPRILEQMRKMARADIAQDQQRLHDKSLGFSR